jgi:transposase
MRSGNGWRRCCPTAAQDGPPTPRPRRMFETIVWLDRTGAPWRDLPAAFGKWQSVASRFDRWRRAGVVNRVLAGLHAQGDAAGELDWLLHFVDGSVVRAHQHAAGARQRPSKADKRDRPSTRRSPRT